MPGGTHVKKGGGFFPAAFFVFSAHLGVVKILYSYLLCPELWDEELCDDDPDDLPDEPEDPPLLWPPELPPPRLPPPEEPRPPLLVGPPP